MININDGASKQFKEAINNTQSDETCVRIYVDGMSCCGPKFGLALDKFDGEDIKHIIDDIDFIMDKKTELIVKENGGLNINFVEVNGVSSGFSVKLQNAGGCC